MEVLSKSAAETRALGRKVAKTLHAGTVVALHGELGAGKTCLTQGIAAGLGVHEVVTSPTFTLIREYRGKKLPLYHIDLYRLDSPAQAVAIGIEDYLHSDGVTVIEWAEKIVALLPTHTIQIEIEPRKNGTRQIKCSPLPLKHPAR